MVASIGYDEASETLEVEFTSGSIYQYYDVPISIYQKFMQARSKGKFMDEYIMDEYPYSRV